MIHAAEDKKSGTMSGNSIKEVRSGSIATVTSGMRELIKLQLDKKRVPKGRKGGTGSWSVNKGWSV